MNNPQSPSLKRIIQMALPAHPSSSTEMIEAAGQLLEYGLCWMRQLESNSLRDKGSILP